MRRGCKAVAIVVLLVSVMILRIAVAQSQPGAAGHRVVRVLDDAATGERWVLELDAEHPGGPGRLTRVEGNADKAERDVAEKAEVVIRAGDRVTVEEKTAKITARLEGVAMAPAARGELVKVRLAVGGWLVRATAEAPGKARLAVRAR